VRGEEGCEQIAGTPLGKALFEEDVTVTWLTDVMLSIASLEIFQKFPLMLQPYFGGFKFLEPRVTAVLT
jgi:hypothetical protein